MTWSDEFVELNTDSHDRESFNCGKEELDDFIKTKASKHRKAGISKTMLLPATEALETGKRQICAFYTITATSISRNDLPPEQAKKLPHYPVPVSLLAQLAVHSDFQGQGLGKITLIKALGQLLEISREMPAYAVIVDCLDEEAEGYYGKYGFEVLCQKNGRTRMYLPMKTINQLFEN